MKTIVKILRGIGFGLFKIHLWLPVLYSIVFLVVVLAAQVANAWAGYAIGLVIALLGSVGLTYYGNYRKLKKGEFSSSKKADEQKPEKRKLLHPKQETEEVLVRNAAQYGYAPQPPMQQQPAPQPPAYDPARNLYPNNYMSEPRSVSRELGYDPRTALYDNHSYGVSDNRSYDHGYDPRAELYGGGNAMITDRPTSDQARQSLYAPDTASSMHQLRESGREVAAQSLYPAAGPAREAVGRSDASNALYPESQQAGFDGYDRASASGALYPNAEPAHSGGYDRTSASGTLYPQSAPAHFDSYDRTSANGALYAQNQQTNYKTFSPYMQPVNSVLPKREAAPSLYDDKPAQPVRQAAPAYDEAARLRSRDEEFLNSVGSPPAVKISRRREVPLQIYATKTDENTYVYEYADRFEFIKLLEDGNKELLKTEFKTD